MSLWNRRSISGRLTRMNLMLCGTALLLAYVSFVAYDLYSLRQNLVESMNTEAAIVGENSVSAIIFDDPQTAQDTLAALRGSPQVVCAEIWHGDGKLFARYLRNASNRQAIQARLNPDQAYGNWELGNNIQVGRKIVYLDRTIGYVYLLAEKSDIAYRVKQFVWISACIIVLCFLIALVATSTVRNLVTAPLTGLAETARVVTRDRDYSVRARLPRASDEISMLVQAFNEMLEQIQERDRALEESRAALEQRVEDRTSELTEANKELEAFSYSVAHDLRGPLQHIGNISFLLEQSCTTGGAECAKLIERLFEASKRMSTLIDDLLNLSRATSTPLHRTPINLSQMAETILETLKAESPGRKVEITISWGAHVIADEGLMTLVMENLLGNAWKYTSRLSVARIEFGFSEQLTGTVYFVRDNGVGFNPRYADRLFRPFQRLHSQGEFPGTGVGLATVSRIIARHHGKIWAKSNVDQGAEFSFTVPYGSES